MASGFVDLPLSGGGSGITELVGDVTAGPGSGVQVATITNIVVTSKTLTGYSSTTGTVTAADTILSAIGKLNGNTSQVAANLATLQGQAVTSLTGEVTGSGPGATATVITNAAVIGKVLTGYVSGAGTVSATDSILAAIQKLNGNTAAISSSAITSLTGEAVATGPGASAVVLSNSAVVGKVITGFVSGAGTVAATDTIVQAFNKMDGNVNAAVATVTGKVNKVGDTMTGSLTVNQAANAQLGYVYSVGGLSRFKLTIAGVESGGQSGSDFVIQRYDDSGVALGGPAVTVARGGGQATFFSTVTGSSFIQTNVNGSSVFGSLVTALKTVTTTYTLDTTTNDSTILCNHSAAFTITLTTQVAGREVSIKDITGQATARPITISAGAATIDGQTTYVLNQNYGAIKLVSNGTNWFVL